MKRHNNVVYLLCLISVLVLSGCTVRTYKVIKDRVDQDLEVGNQGYLIGEVSEGRQLQERNKTRVIQRIEIELPLVKELKKMFKAKPAEKTEDPVFKEEPAFVSESDSPFFEAEPEPEVIEKYTVQEGDTLQKISKKFYGTAKKWAKIYEANRSILRGPDKVYPGQVIDIPVESWVEPPERTQEKFK